MQVIAALCLYNSLWPQNLPDWETSVYVLCSISSVTAQDQNFPATPTKLGNEARTLISGGDNSSVLFTVKSSILFHDLVGFEVI